jgi:hypothetical protein
MIRMPIGGEPLVIMRLGMEIGNAEVSISGGSTSEAQTAAAATATPTTATTRAMISGTKITDPNAVFV